MEGKPDGFNEEEILLTHISLSAFDDQIQGRYYEIHLHPLQNKGLDNPTEV